MAFDNTVTSVGEAALTESIITRSIMELCDESVYELGRDSLHGCAQLVIADFPNLNKINTDAFRDCSKLKFLFLRNSLMCSLSYNALYGTPIANGTGYVYVPKSLENTYKQSSSWSTLANQIRAIEDFPEMCDAPTAWWTMVAESIAAGTYKTDFAIGDTVPLNLGSEGVVNMQVAAFDTDDLADGSGKAAITWVAKELMVTRRRMTPSYVSGTEGTGAVGGWGKSEIRAYLANEIKPILPASLQSQIAPVTKSQQAFDTSETKFTQTTTDELWLLGYDEVWNLTTLFPDQASRAKFITGTTTTETWWLRDAYDRSNYRYVNPFGSLTPTSYATSTYKYGVCLCFCTGKAK